MHKQIQESVCFHLGRRADDRADAAVEYITLGHIFFALMILVDMYALDLAARQLAVHIIIPMLGGR